MIYFERSFIFFGCQNRRYAKTAGRGVQHQKNLKHATQVELKEIDEKYPQYLKKLNIENHRSTIRFVTYAWESEKQHRDLIKRIKSGTGIFFGILKKEFNESPSDYFVCRSCGSTLTEVPEITCPICGKSASMYQEVEKE